MAKTSRSRLAASGSARGSASRPAGQVREDGRGPRAIGNVLAELMAQKGFGRVRSAERFQEAWREAAGELAAGYTRVGLLRRGRLEITVANSMLVQELTYQKPSLLRILRERLPDEKIKDLYFRVGSVEGEETPSFGKDAVILNKPRSS